VQLTVQLSVAHGASKYCTQISVLRHCFLPLTTLKYTAVYNLLFMYIQLVTDNSVI
jgi:hypothetical protein